MSEATPEEVEEAILLLDVYASQGMNRELFVDVEEALGVSETAAALALDAWKQADSGLDHEALEMDAAEAAQLLREGWRP